MHPVLFHVGAILIPSFGAFSALGVVLALFLAQRTARSARVNPAHVWNLSVLAVLAALLAQRLLLVVVNFNDLRHHPAWMLAIAMIQHPLLTLVGALAGVAAAIAYARRQHMPLTSTADALAAPLALGLAFEQFGTLLAGSGFGTETRVRWSVTYTHPLAARWSGAPLFVPVHPVQAYAALSFLTLALFLLVYLPVRRAPGDIAGIWLMAAGVIVFLTEFYRDPTGRGSFFNGVLDAPQIAAILFVLAGGWCLRERKSEREAAHA